MTDKTERTFIMAKPDGVQRGLVGEIIKRFEDKGYKLVALKFTQVSAGWTLTFFHLTSSFPSPAITGAAGAALR